MIKGIFKIAYSLMDPEGLLHKEIVDRDLREAALKKYLEEMENIKTIVPGLALIDHRSLPEKTRKYLKRLGGGVPFAVRLDELYAAMGEKPLSLGSMHGTIYLPEKGNYLSSKTRGGLPESVVDKAIIPYHELVELREGYKTPGAHTFFMTPSYPSPIRNAHVNKIVLEDEYKTLNELMNIYNQISGGRRYQGHTRSVDPKMIEALDYLNKNISQKGLPAKSRKAIENIFDILQERIRRTPIQHFIPHYRQNLSKEYNIFNHQIPLPGRDEVMAVNVLSGNYDKIHLPGLSNRFNLSPAERRDLASKFTKFIKGFTKKLKVR